MHRARTRTTWAGWSSRSQGSPRTCSPSAPPYSTRRKGTPLTTQLFDLTGRIALVTGASRGIGEAIAMLLAEQGAHVIVSSRKLDDCKAVADALVAAGGQA